MDETRRIVSQTGTPRCAVEGQRRGDETGPCKVLALRVQDGYDLLPHGLDGMRVHLGRDAARELGDFLTGDAA